MIFLFQNYEFKVVDGKCCPECVEGARLFQVLIFFCLVFRLNRKNWATRNVLMGLYADIFIEEFCFVIMMLYLYNSAFKSTLNSSIALCILYSGIDSVCIVYCDL